MVCTTVSFSGGIRSIKSSYVQALGLFEAGCKGLPTSSVRVIFVVTAGTISSASSCASYKHFLSICSLSLCIKSYEYSCDMKA